MVEIPLKFERIAKKVKRKQIDKRNTRIEKQK